MRGVSLAAALWGVMLGGCATSEALTPHPVIPLPAQWSENAPTLSLTPTGALDANWWRSFGSATLNDLIEQALHDNPDLLLAQQRIRQAHIALDITHAARMPTIGSSVGVSQTQRDPDGQASSHSKSTAVGLSMSYELDLWGRIAAHEVAAQHSVQVSRFDYESARLSLVAHITSTYMQALATGQRLTIAQDNLALAQRILAIAEARLRNGVATRLEVSQQRTTVLAQEAALIPLSVQVRQLHSALALLLGRNPQHQQVGSEDFAAVQIPTPSPYMPSVLLTRRPDIAAAEAALAASDANVTAARAALLPSVSLSASGSVGSALLLDLTHPTRSLNLALSLVHTIFDGGRLRLQTENAQSQHAVQIITYGKVVRTALKEVEDSLGNVEQTAQQERAQQAVSDQALRTLELAQLRYSQGVGDLLSVLEAQRSVFSARDQQISVRLARLQAAIDLSKALGGGWEKPLEQPPSHS